MNANSENTKWRILLVEDNSGDVGLVRLALEKAELDYELTVLNDGAEALALVHQQREYAGFTAPDLLILDLNLPKYDGAEILKALRANPAFANVRIAVLSSSFSRREREKIEQYQISCYITKPLALDEFLQIGVTLKELLTDQACGGVSVGA